MRLPAPIPLERLAAPDRPTIPPWGRTALLSALDSGTHAIGLFDDNDRLVYSNAAFRCGWAIDDVHDVTFDSMIRTCHQTKRGAVVATDDIDGWLGNARRRRREGPADRSFEVDLWDGRWMWLTERRLDDGWLLFVAQDITALKYNECTLRAARDAAVKTSLTDPLTHLPNRRHAMQVLEANVAQGGPFHVGLIDVDSFKQINNRYGHAAGDEVLIMLGSELAQLEGKPCFVARLAGDEFLVISTEHTVTAFMCLLQDLLHHRSQCCSTSDPSQTFGISIGAASFPNDGCDARELLSAADTAMYRAKSRGKCTLQFATPRRS